MKRIRATIYELIFEADTPAGKAFDVLLLTAIICSVVAVMADSVTWLRESYGVLFLWLEWTFTLLFTLEYALRLYCSPHPKAYAVSFFGLVDLMAILPTYIGLFIPGGQYLMAIRILRVLRVFRVLKFVHYVAEARQLQEALSASRHKITVFLVAVVSLVVVLGSLMYLIEGEANGFTSIPRSVYWAIVTLTTVGYGDISPGTPFGQTVAALIMIIGYGIIAVPTGIVTVELARVGKERRLRHCPSCGLGEERSDARFCRQCATALRSASSPGNITS